MTAPIERSNGGSNISEKRIVSRGVAIGLGTVCIVLAAGLGVVMFMNYPSTSNGSVTSLQNQVASLQDQMNELTSIVNLVKSTVWVNNQTVSQPAGGSGVSYTNWTFSASYAGYVSVNVLTSTTSRTYARVVYSAYGVDYDTQISVNASLTKVFPILPSSSIQVGVGNGNPVDGATETVTITYHY